MSKIGIFPGAFDPVHEGHLTFAKKALAHGLEKVYFMPEPVSRQKPGISDVEKRISQIRGELVGSQNINVLEPHQETFTTRKTLEYLSDKFVGEEIVFLFGDDILDHIADWDNLTELAKETELIIATRKYSEEEIVQKFKQLADKGINFKYQIVEVNLPISSTQIRNI